MSASHIDGADDEPLRVRDAAHRDVDTLYKSNLGDHSLDSAKGLIGEADGAHLDAKSAVPAGDGVADEEPLYVNAKQYQRILKRRAARQRIERKRRIDIARTTLKNAKDAGEMDLSSFDLTKPYQHESRHKHAMRRPRGPGGRFLTAEEIKAKEEQEEQEQEQASGEPGIILDERDTSHETAGLAGHEDAKHAFGFDQDETWALHEQDDSARRDGHVDQDDLELLNFDV
ncbi:hypothetical protein IE81DRAFT_286428 [Ceraceosorus guamensis]|uniref:Transcriptional activator HAP2 n=1 Tax=Ceraceosorus guamensis TaxID=1522189 RepID=A0A316W5F0_9BASI|nr:hypothetical protein IE81DRAFT_286428 [Ceraceosorus guamensis]PWN44854.1 hypothetical protein IE81DRAFT_286428 [Ceraceosorus guamensis]